MKASCCETSDRLRSVTGAFARILKGSYDEKVFSISHGFSADNIMANDELIADPQIHTRTFCLASDRKIHGHQEIRTL